MDADVGGSFHTVYTTRTFIRKILTVPPLGPFARNVAVPKNRRHTPITATAEGQELEGGSRGKIASLRRRKPLCVLAAHRFAMRSALGLLAVIGAARFEVWGGAVPTTWKSGAVHGAQVAEEEHGAGTRPSVDVRTQGESLFLLFMVLYVAGGGNAVRALHGSRRPRIKYTLQTASLHGGDDRVIVACTTCTDSPALLCPRYSRHDTSCFLLHRRGG